jgi:predicted enzyme related to lactoylglutathione lyase
VINTLQVEDLDAVRAKVDAAGGALVHGPQEIPGVGTHAYFKDPAGIIFGAMQPAAAEA